MDGEDALEVKRQLFHLLNGSAIAVEVYLLKPLWGLWVLAPLLAAILLLYALPKYMAGWGLVKFLMQHFERRKDIETFPFRGAILYGVGIIFPIAFLDVRYGCAVILILSFGDAFSTLVGRRYGRIKVGKRSVEGSAAFLLTSILPAALLVGLPHAIILSLAGTVIELFDPFDDNVTVPLGLTLLSLLL